MKWRVRLCLGLVPWQDIYKSVYPTLVLDILKCGSFKILVKNEATIGVFGYDIPVVECAVLHALRVVSYSVRLRVARPTKMGMPQPQDAGRVTDTDSHALFLLMRRLSMR